jgi:hypothetical protein
MWIIFGWKKIETPLGEIGATRCFDCQRDSQWLVWNVAEWVTFSELKVFRFVHKHELQCGGCATTLSLRRAEFRQIDRYMRQQGSIEGTQIHAALSVRIETQQLATKTPLQLQFIRSSMAAKREHKERVEREEETS